MSDLRKAAQAALEALESILCTLNAGELLAVSLAERCNNLRAALAAPDADLGVEKAWARFCLENCRLYAARHHREEWAKTILRFCDEAGVKGSPLRVPAPPQREPDAEPMAPPALLWQLRHALARASAICDAVPNRQEGHLGVLVNAQPDGTHGYREIQDAETALVTYLTTPVAAAPPQEPPPQAEAASDSASDSAGFLYCWLVEEFGPDGNSTGRYMLDMGSLAITHDVYAARRLRREQSAGFRALDMKERHGGDWRPVEHGFAV